MKLLNLLLLVRLSIVNIFAQNIEVISETTLFIRTADNYILVKPSYIAINNQPSGNPSGLNMYHNYQLQSLNKNYN